MAAEIINLNRARKAKARDQKAKKADENRVLHGTPKHLKQLGKARTEKDTRDAEGRKLKKDED
ncbi:MAG TPA: DUF4169 family protein [Rhizomicrobium sp.]|jgi:hypothetical protein|nr:DUF4169 family protein [Rhizomicrobium sp.]